MNIKIGLESEVSGCFDNAGKMKFEDAVEAAIRCAIPVSQTERVALLRAAGRILAGDVGAPVPLPRFDHSAMDGFAVRTRSFDGPGPWNARIESVIAAGSSGSRSVPEDHAAVEIYTGAPIPYGFDAVMTRESCVRADGKIAFHVAPTPGLNIRKAGEDIVDGEVAVTDGSVVTPHIAALLAGLGIREIEVRPKVRVAFFSTGSELRQPGERLQDGQLYDSNRYMVTAMLALPWIDFTDLCHLDDNLDMIAQCLADASNQFDVVIASGGMSHGGADFMRQALIANGGELSVSSVLMRPGKPGVIGRVSNALFIGLPGNPMAAAVVLEQIGLPALRATGGMRLHRSPCHSAIAGFELTKREGRTEFVPVRVIGENDIGLPVLAKLGRGSSGSLSPMAQGDGIALLEPKTTCVSTGQAVQFYPFG
ncbi:molybdopterin molybdotransferase MoeA [Brucella tritici]|uniref:Molybdopterin molybdenumtransferase n=1 Tax=Brucella tritici TaxID=94626 RepID=A0A833FL43_9HYPH|nr:molybdopterin molybdotransferase MoeA [Brucella tritici]KAB2663339.1 molybdopterin molybdotransferase MoeA [Brucella tritici]